MARRRRRRPSVRGHITDSTLAGVSVDERPVVAVSTDDGCLVPGCRQPRRRSTELAMDERRRRAWSGPTTRPRSARLYVASGTDVAQHRHRQGRPAAQEHRRDAGRHQRRRLERTGPAGPCGGCPARTARPRCTSSTHTATRCSRMCRCRSHLSPRSPTPSPTGRARTGPRSWRSPPTVPRRASTSVAMPGATACRACSWAPPPQPSCTCWRGCCSGAGRWACSRPPWRSRRGCCSPTRASP